MLLLNKQTDSWIDILALGKRFFIATFPGYLNKRFGEMASKFLTYILNLRVSSYILIGTHFGGEEARSPLKISINKCYELEIFFNGRYG